MNIKIIEGLPGVLFDVALAVLPLLLFFLIFQIFFLKLPKEKVKTVIYGFIATFIGLSLFLHGVHIGFMPIGREMGKVLGELSYSWIIVPIGFVLGFVATIAEPAIKVLNKKIETVTSGDISQRAMLLTLSTGVGISIALSMLRILLDIPLLYFLIPGYTVVLILIFMSKKGFIEIAFDTGGVATGPMTVTFILSIAVGAASVIEGRDPLLDGFGMIALVALAPIISVLLFGLVFHRRKGSEQTAE
ncbi:DUF1538 domain-containing protein [Rossellomorea vietnamensis]|uniref:DUF1538 domain-containing protein n=1 Tax=Rossellomorea vietnamensis TaxID=218284 RepID=A0A5D4KBQ5_9BACI|nr:DUF1538 domain-containing protein [Rossellomorea vietnamensis]TYR73553.1 DUF1538 domain-containing protein [Rossellomorea vietnamensis]